MGTSAIAGYPTPTGGSAPRIRLDMEDLAAAVEVTACPTFASTGARDSAYATAIAAGKVGMTCYITDRAGFSEYVHISSAGTKAWRWKPQLVALAEPTAAAAAESTGGALIPIILTGPFVLPAGNRRIKVKTRSICTQLTSGEARPQGVLTGNGLGTNQGVSQCTTTFLGDTGVVECEVTVTTSGTVSYSYQGRDGHATIAHTIRFTDSFMQVFDLGPA
jgi:hypothetical protein